MELAGAKGCRFVGDTGISKLLEFDGIIGGSGSSCGKQTQNADKRQQQGRDSLLLIMFFIVLSHFGYVKKRLKRFETLFQYCIFVF